MDIYPIQTKQCIKCDTTKSIEHFSKKQASKDGFKTTCKSCDRERKQQYNKDNSKSIYEYNKSYRLANPEKIKSYRLANKENYKTNNNKEYQKKYRLLNADNRKKYQKEKRDTDPLYKMKGDIRCRICQSISNKGYTKKSKTADILGCSFYEFYNHIENQFLDGMSWDNRSEWHLDHIVPLAFAQTEQEIIMLNHYTNFRPLWAIENQIKKDKITDDALIHPLYNKLIEMRK